MPARVLSVGQCGLDHGNISETLRQHFGAEVVPAATTDEATKLLAEDAFDLVLVNRVFDLNGADGVKFIRQSQALTKDKAVPIMLVSNYQEYQDQAVAAGAVPGFGKAALDHPATLGRLRTFLAKSQT